jgi:hypothetical protein
LILAINKSTIFLGNGSRGEFLFGSLVSGFGANGQPGFLGPKIKGTTPATIEMSTGDCVMANLDIHGASLP